MHPLAPLVGILIYVLELFKWCVIASIILSWLVAFDVINLRNRIVYNVARFLDAVTRPILRPFQRIIPPLGGVDITPILALLVIQGARMYLLPLIFDPIRGALG